MWLPHISYSVSEGQACAFSLLPKLKAVSPQQREGGGDSAIPSQPPLSGLQAPAGQAADSCYLLRQTPDVNHLGCQGKCELFSKQ